jgi:aminoglycoside 3-N-acetyltransferase
MTSRCSSFVTTADLARDLRALGVAGRGVLMVHSSLSSLGRVLGGAPAVVRALLTVLGPGGTLVMPTFSPEVSDPACWTDWTLSGDELERARAEVPAFDPETTPTTMGAIPETFRRWPGAVRGPHPQVSVCARGPQAVEVVTPHALEWGQGAGSPFERLAAMDAGLLLLGVGFNRATLLHYAESLVPHGRRKTRRIPVGEGAARRWAEAPCVGDDLNTHFPAIGAAYLAAGRARTGRVGEADAVFASAADLVDFAADYLTNALPQRVQPAD